MGFGVGVTIGVGVGRFSVRVGEGVGGEQAVPTMTAARRSIITKDFSMTIKYPYNSLEGGRSEPRVI